MVNANTYSDMYALDFVNYKSVFRQFSQIQNLVYQVCRPVIISMSDEVLLHCTLPQFAHICRFRLCLYAFGRLQQRHTLSTRCYSIRWQTTWHDRNRPTRYCFLYRKLLRRTPTAEILYHIFSAALISCILLPVHLCGCEV